MMHILGGHIGFAPDIGKIAVRFHTQQSAQVTKAILAGISGLCLCPLTKIAPEGG
jgi:hypothetical protein